MKLVLIALASALAAGCNTAQTRADRLTEGQPPAYRAGFGDGCYSGYSAAGNPYYRLTKDVRRYSSDDLYRMGWDDGMVNCKGNYESTTSMWR